MNKPSGQPKSLQVIRKTNGPWHGSGYRKSKGYWGQSGKSLILGYYQWFRFNWIWG